MVVQQREARGELPTAVTRLRIGVARGSVTVATLGRRDTKKASVRALITTHSEPSSSSTSTLATPRVSEDGREVEMMFGSAGDNPLDTVAVECWLPRDCALEVTCGRGSRVNVTGVYASVLVESAAECHVALDGFAASVVDMHARDSHVRILMDAHVPRTTRFTAVLRGKSELLVEDAQFVHLSVDGSSETTVRLGRCSFVRGTHTRGTLGTTTTTTTNMMWVRAKSVRAWDARPRTNVDLECTDEANGDLFFSSISPVVLSTTRAPLPPEVRPENDENDDVGGARVITMRGTSAVQLTEV